MKLSKTFFIQMLLLSSTFSFAGVWNSQISDVVQVGEQARYQFVTLDSDQQNAIHSVDMHEVILKKGHYSAQIVNQDLGLGFFGAPRVNQTTFQEHAFLGINAGFFTPDNQPLGLLIQEGKKLSRLIHSPLLSGIVAIDPMGNLDISSIEDQYNDQNAAFQAGPILFKANANVVIRKTNKADRRTVLAVSNSGDLIVLITTPVSLYDLAQLIKDQEKTIAPDGLKIAINLDGGTSTSMSLFLPGKRPLIVPEILPVRNVVLFKLK